MKPGLFWKISKLPMLSLSESIFSEQYNQSVQFDVSDNIDIGIVTCMKQLKYILMNEHMHSTNLTYDLFVITKT